MAWPARLTKGNQEPVISAAATVVFALVASGPNRSVVTVHHQADSDGNYQHFESRHSPRLAR